MNTRMEEIMHAIEHNKLTADDPFRFHCTQCGKCCINREDILLTPLDLFRIANELKLSLKEFIDQYCELYIGPDSHFPIIRLKPRGSIKRCPLLKTADAPSTKQNLLCAPCFQSDMSLRFRKMELLLTHQ